MDEARGRDALQKVDVGKTGAHEGTHALTGKLLCIGIYWPTTHQDTVELTNKCAECQAYSPVQGNPPVPLTNISSPWPFYQWGIDIVGPFPEAPGKLKYMVVAMDYFTKWIEAKPLVCISGRHIIEFVWENILTRF